MDARRVRPNYRVTKALLDGVGVLQDGGIVDERRAANFPRRFWDRTGLYQE
jgi:hypothetical protein